MMARICRRAVLPALILVLCLAGCPTAAAASFSDVPENYWAYSDIMEMQSRGMIQGSGGKFRPSEPVSQQAFLSMVCRAAGLDDRKLESGSGWSDPAMAYGFYQGWYDEEEITATTRTQPVSRELAAKLLVNALFPEALEHAQPAAAFQDADSISRDRLPYVQAAVGLGLIGGYEDGRFDPQGSLTRAASAALLCRALTFLDQDRPEAGASLQVPVLMYHDVSYLGSGYSKTPEVFKKQMQELKDAGFHTVFFSQLIDYVDKGVPLPSKPVVITLDDGYRSNYEYAYPILQELDMKAEISLIGAAMQYTSWGLKWDDVREMAASGLVSFQCHTYQMHGDYTDEGGRLGVLKAPDESWQEYVEALGADTVKALNLIESKTGVRPVTFTYPRGKWNTMAEAVVTSLGCRASVTTKDGVAVVRQGDPSSLHLMDRIGMDFLNGSVVSVLKQYGYKG
ncbi:MAG: polysaccharide deacetylase family protein [Oscillospiraceae bacterium]|nr:polysaccharide deacetylase family protein [Oscillospiraceae bacterium]